MSLARRFVLFVLVPALITGFFAIAPKLYDELIRTRASLTYNIVSGPAISEAGTYRQIFSVAISNTGKVPLTAVGAEISTSSGQIDKLAVAPVTGLHPKVDNTPTLARVFVERMLPTDTINLSLMTTSPRSSPNMRINVRSDQVLGEGQSPQAPSTGNSLLLVLPGALSAAGAVAAMALFFLGSRRFGGFLAVFSKADIITYIIALSDVIPIPDEVMFREHNLTYARTADLFLYFGMKGDDVTKARCVMGLKALLLIRLIRQGSLEVIEENLLTLDNGTSKESLYKIRAESVSFANETELRRKIWNVFHP